MSQQLAQIDVQKVEAWLVAIGCQPVRTAEPRARWRLDVSYPAGTPHQMVILNPKDRPLAIMIANAATISPEHVEAFNDLGENEKRDFLWELQSVLNTDYVEYTLFDLTDGTTCPSGFEIASIRYEDGLTLDSFARSVSSVFKTKLAGIKCVQRYLGGRDPSEGRQLQYKRLATQ